MNGRIVVGVDGSRESQGAWRYALEEARRRDATVEVVHAYHVPVSGPPDVYASSITWPPERDLRERAREVIEHTIGQVPTDVEVEQVVTSGPPAAALLRIASGADLLVLGSRGRGGFAGLLLGSVSQQVVPHAPCPVVVVPDGHGRRGDERAA